MRKNLKVGVIAMVMMMGASVANMPVMGNIIGQQEVYASTIEPLKIVGTKKAVSKEVKVSFDGAEPVNIQVYTIDGVDFYNSKEIADCLNMQLRVVPREYGNDTGIRLTPWIEAQDEIKPVKTSNSTTDVEIIKAKIFYDGLGEDNIYDCFVLNENYYYKLADLQFASDHYVQRYTDLNTRKAKAGFATEPSPKYLSGIKLYTDSETGIIHANKDGHDMWELWNSIKGISNATANNSLTVPVNSNNEKKEIIEVGNVKDEKQTLLTSAPKVGEQLGNILIDESKNAYLADGTVNINNLYEPYKSSNLSYFGQCTWYARGRINETTGATYEWTGKGLPHWLNEVISGNIDGLVGTDNINDIKPQSIAVWKGHVAFIEYVEYDNQGTPLNVYFTEGNTNSNGKYDVKKDGIVVMKSFDKFAKSNGGLLGYVTAK